MANHYLYKGVKDTVEYPVDIEEGLLFHYRDYCGYDYCIPKFTTSDYTARIYGRNLWKIVEDVCGQIFEDGICPFK